MNHSALTLSSFLFALAVLLSACGGGGTNSSSTVSGSAPDVESGLTAFQMKHGIGPVTETIGMGSVDAAMAAKGRSIFQTKCEACHSLDSRMVGPELGGVLDRRSPEFVMNMIMNPSGMLNEHPEGQKLLQQYMTPMPFQNVSVDEARSIVEFLREYSDN